MVSSPLPLPRIFGNGPHLLGRFHVDALRRWADNIGNCYRVCGKPVEHRGAGGNGWGIKNNVNLRRGKGGYVEITEPFLKRESGMIAPAVVLTSSLARWRPRLGSGALLYTRASIG